MTEPTTSPSPAQPRGILIATDLSPRSDRALDRAVQLARDWPARLVALTVLEHGSDGASPSALVRASGRVDDVSAHQRAERRLRADLDLPDLPLVVRVQQGAVVDTVLQVAEAEACSLVVAGVARNEALSRVVLGSTVDDLARRSPLPLLVVRERARAAYRRVLVATDLSAVSRHALQTAVALFPEAQFTLFHAFGNPYPLLVGMDAAQARNAGYLQAERHVADFLQATPLPEAVRSKLRLLLSHGDAGLLLHEHGQDHPADLVVLGTERRKGLLGLLIGSMAQRILEMAENDVLVVPPPA